MQDPNGIIAPETVEEGGVLVVEVGAKTDFISLAVPGVGLVDVPVIAGTAEYRLPPTVTGGGTIIISDNAGPPPNGASVLVTSNQRS